jgi:hypothetical protein
LDKEACNVIIVDWSGPAQGPLYNVAQANAQPTGQYVGQMHNYLGSLGHRVSDSHCIGHSLGAHVCGFSGKTASGAIFLFKFIIFFTKYQLALQAILDASLAWTPLCPFLASTTQQVVSIRVTLLTSTSSTLAAAGWASIGSWDTPISTPTAAASSSPAVALMLLVCLFYFKLYASKVQYLISFIFQ